MDDTTALRSALEVAKSFQSGAQSPLETAREMTGIINPWRDWWIELGGADGPLSAFYEADGEALGLPWIGEEVERWEPAVRETKRQELQAAELRWQDPIDKACAALVEYAKTRNDR